MDGFHFFKVLGIPIRINYTWFIVFVLVVWTLAMGYFPHMGPQYTPLTRWIMSIITAIILFASILIHELSHSYMAQRQGIKIKSITLFIFGGIAQMAGETRSPKGEMKIAAAGPIMSILISGIFWMITYVTYRTMPSSPILPVAQFLAYTNMILAFFNLIPGFPLDGGRLLRAAIWQKTGDLNKATLITSRIGKGFALFLMFTGFWNILRGFLIDGIWLIFIGMFLQQAAEEGYRQTLLHKTFSAVKVKDIMVTPVIVVDENLSIDRVVNEYFFKYRYNTFPVVSDNRLKGMISIHDIKKIQKEMWPFTSVREVMNRNLDEFTISPEQVATEALQKMIETHSGRLIVVEDNKVIGIISQRDIMRMLKLKTDLGV